MARLLQLTDFEERAIARNRWPLYSRSKPLIGGAGLTIENVALCAVALWIAPSAAGWRLAIVFACLLGASCS